MAVERVYADDQVLAIKKSTTGQVGEGGVGDPDGDREVVYSS